MKGNKTPLLLLATSNCGFKWSLGTRTVWESITPDFKWVFIIFSVHGISVTSNTSCTHESLCRGKNNIVFMMGVIVTELFLAPSICESSQESVNNRNFILRHRHKSDATLWMVIAEQTGLFHSLIQRYWKLPLMGAFSPNTHSWCNVTLSYHTVSPPSSLTLMTFNQMVQIKVHEHSLPNSPHSLPSVRLTLNISSFPLSEE